MRDFALFSQLPHGTASIILMNKQSLFFRICKFFAALSTVLFFVYVLLPKLTHSSTVLQKMSLCLEENSIDPSRYYYTDIEQVKESEQYLDVALQ
jgi:hypothetical protein